MNIPFMNFQVILRVIFFVTAIHIASMAQAMRVDHVLLEAVALFQKFVTYLALKARVRFIIVTEHMLSKVSGPVKGLSTNITFVV